MSLSNRYTDSSVKVISSSNQIYILILVILCFEPLLYRFHRFPELSLNFNEKHHNKLLFKLIQSWTELIGRVYLLCEEGDSDKEIYCFLNILFTWLSIAESFISQQRPEGRWVIRGWWWWWWWWIFCSPRVDVHKEEQILSSVQLSWVQGSGGQMTSQHLMAFIFKLIMKIKHKY